MDLHIEGIASSFDDAIKQAVAQGDKFFGTNRFYVFKIFEAHPYEVNYASPTPDSWIFNAVARYGEEVDD